MMPAPSDRIEAIFCQALGLPAAARVDYLDAACGPDAALRVEVRIPARCA